MYKERLYCHKSVIMIFCKIFFICYLDIKIAHKRGLNIVAKNVSLGKTEHTERHYREQVQS